jgi:hypothetical protein
MKQPSLIVSEALGGRVTREAARERLNELDGDVEDVIFDLGLKVVIPSESEPSLSGDIITVDLEGRMFPFELRADTTVESIKLGLSKARGVEPRYFRLLFNSQDIKVVKKDGSKNTLYDLGVRSGAVLEGIQSISKYAGIATPIFILFLKPL